jgi:hypothetical protein
VAADSRTLSCLSIGLGLLSVILQARATTLLGDEAGVAGSARSPKRAVAEAKAPAKNPPANKASPTDASATNENKYAFILPDGATFDFLSVCESSSVGKTWWRPDGTPLITSPEGAVFPRRNNKSDDESVNRGFTIAMQIPEGAALSIGGFANGTGEHGLGTRWKMLGRRRVGNYYMSLPAARPVTMVFKYAAGDWKTVKICPAHGEIVCRIDQGDVLFSHPLEKNGGFNLSIAYVGDDADVRVIAVDRDAHERISLARRGFDFDFGKPSPIHVLDAQFNLALARVKEFRLQTRPLHRIEFREISMNRGEKSNFGFFVDGKPHDPERHGKK